MANSNIWKNSDYITAIMKQSGLTNTLKQMCNYSISPQADYSGATFSGFLVFYLIPLRTWDKILYLNVKVFSDDDSFIEEIKAEYVKNNKRQPPNDDAVVLYAIFLAFKTFKNYIEEAMKQAPTFDNIVSKLRYGDDWMQSITQDNGKIINYCGGNYIAITDY